MLGKGTFPGLAAPAPAFLLLQGQRPWHCCQDSLCQLLLPGQWQPCPLAFGVLMRCDWLDGLRSLKGRDSTHNCMAGPRCKDNTL